tara:strand:+ start:2318 stop:2611 length:294 start_codon:yes stop_codon:yes gene_type:complete
VGGNAIVISKGTLVRMKHYDHCKLSLKIAYAYLVELYPPEGSVCIVLSNPKEKDLAYQTGYSDKSKNHIMLRKSIDVICEGQVFSPCLMAAFDEVKK